MTTETNELKTPEFETLLVEEKLTPKQLPAEIFNKINTYKMGVGRYKKNPTDKALDILKASDIAICDMIQDYLEKDVDEETPEQKIAREQKEKDAADKLAKDKEDADKAEQDRLTKEKEDKAKADQAVTDADKQKGVVATGSVNQTVEQQKAAQVEAELSALFNAEKYSLTLQELKQSAPVCYADIFQAYKEGEENGIQTSHFLIKETEKEKFTLSKL